MPVYIFLDIVWLTCTWRKDLLQVITG